jgi:hypothetical protein
MDRAQARPRSLSVARPAVAVLLLLGLTLTSDAASQNGWQFDVLQLKTGKTWAGLIIDEGSDWIQFQIINQEPGKKTRLSFTTTVRLNEIAKLDRLSDKDRATLKEKLNTLDPNGKAERARMEEIVLKDGAWLPGISTTAKPFCYGSEHFILVSNANDEIIRRVAVRLEDIYSAYTRFLPPRINKGKKTRIYLVRSGEEYQAIVKKQGRNILNPAFYDTAENQILCKSDLEQLGEDLARVKKKHAVELAKLANQEMALRKEFKNKIPPALMRTILVEREKIKARDQKNDAIFNEATEQLFQTLYHEAFHAYLANFVYPPEEASVPRWLNEGLAQIFETAIVEAGGIRVGHAPADRYNALKDAIAKKQLLEVTPLLKSGPKQFLVAHGDQKQVSDRYYLNSWALAFYLTFDRRLLGTPALDRYVQSLKRGTDEVEAFRMLTGGKSLSQFERDYRDYLARLRADGALKPR